MYILPYRTFLFTLFLFLFYRISKVSTQKERQNYIIVCFVLVLPLNGNPSFTSIAFFDIFTGRSRLTFQMTHRSNVQKLSANTLVLQKQQLFAIMALLTKLSLSTSKRQLRKTQVWKWQKRRLRLQHLQPFQASRQQAEVGLLTKLRVRITKPRSSA